MKILLICPESKSSFRFTPKDARRFWFPRNSIVQLAAMTPPEHEVVCIDEVVQQTPLDEDFDLVGLSPMTYQAPRAYELSAHFRARGVPVVMGGYHVTGLPDEAQPHADALVLGEAEGIWPGLLQDVQQGTLKRRYHQQGFPSLVGLPPPRRDLIPKNLYFTRFSVETTRGCPHDCSYCDVTSFFGRSFRWRPIPEIVAELKQIQETEGKNAWVFICSDNMAGNRRETKALMQAMIDEGITLPWGSQCTLNLANDKELLDLARRSNCVAMFVGLETISQENLMQVRKSFNKVGSFIDQIQAFHDHEIMVNTGMIFGLPEDDEGVFERTLEFLVRTRIELALFSILVPLPTTKIFHEMREQIFDFDWSHYDGKHVVFRHKRLSVEALYEGWCWTYRHFYNFRNIGRRVLPTERRILARLASNLVHRQMAHRIPRGSLTPLARIFRGGWERALGTHGMELLSALKVKVGRLGETAAIQLEGTLDHIALHELWEKVHETATKARMSIELNLRDVEIPTEAVQALGVKLRRTLEKLAAQGRTLTLLHLDEDAALALRQLFGYPQALQIIPRSE